MPSEQDALTGLPSKASLEERVRLDVYTAPDRTLRADFLCIDIEDFARYLANYGFGPADQALVDLASELVRVYGEGNVYRFGGDEFVVRNVRKLSPKIQEKFEFRLKEAHVDIEIPVDHRRESRAASWVMLHIHRGVVESKQGGREFVCRARD
jgi:diguanylate cyclase (GGDEF)-like protein